MATGATTAGATTAEPFATSAAPASAAPTADAGPAQATDPSTLFTRDFHSAKEQLVTGFERTYLERLVQRADHNLARAARLASIDRTTLYRLLEKHGLQRSDFGEPTA